MFTPISRRRFGMLTAAGMAAPLAAHAQEHSLLDAQMTLVFGNPASIHSAIEQLADHGKPDIIPGLILALRFGRMSPVPVLGLLDQLARQIDGPTGPERTSWNEWMLWQEANPDVIPHASYAEFKRTVLLAIDPNFDVFLRPEYLAREGMHIRLEEITWGGVRKDGIPSLDDAELVAANDPKAGYLTDDDLVFGVAINGDVRAYPLRIMGWHEMFNAVIGGVPVALAYCTLCGSGILFETERPGQDAPYVFGSSGFLYRSNKLMFDRQTHSLWNQFTGKPVVGPLVGQGIELSQRPVVIQTWADWRTQNPNTQVVTRNTGHNRNYGSGVVYQDYFASDNLMFPTIVDQSRHAQKDYVFGIRAFGGAKAWPLDAFGAEPLINDRVGEVDVVLIGNPNTRTVRAYERKGKQFTQNATTGQITSSEGINWALTEDALVTDTGEQLARVAGHIAYWFAWNGYLSDVSEVYGD